MKILRTAVIGCGGIASEAHIPNCFAVPSIELVALCDTEPARLEAVGNRFGIAAENRYVNLEVLTKRADIDAFLICTPANTHYRIALLAAQAGKHVFVEKPMAADVAEANEMVRVFADAGLTLAVGHYLEFMPQHAYVKERVRRGNIGDVITATIHDEIIRIKPEEGIILDLSTHYVDLLRWYFDDSPVQSVFAISRKMTDSPQHLETVAEIKLFFQNGVVGNVHLYWVPAYFNRDACSKSITIIGTEGKYKTAFTTASVEVYRSNTFFNKLRGPYEFVPKFVAFPEMPISATSFRKEIEEFAHCVLNGKRPTVSGEEGLQVMAVLAAAYKSISERRVVDVAEVLAESTLALA